MKSGKRDSRKFGDLRERAEAVLGTPNSDLPDMSPDEARKLLHELRTHQIELEMQNEELRRAQIELVESRDRYSDLYDSAPMGYVTISEKGLIVEANMTASNLLGAARHDLLRSPLSRYICSDSQDQYYLHLRSVREGKGERTCELQCEKEDGTPLPVELRSRPVLDEHGSVVRFRTSLVDISERKRMEEELTKSNTNMAEAQQIAHIGSYDWDIETNEITWSDELYRIYGVENTGKPLSFESVMECIHADDVPAITENLKHMFGGGAARPFDYRAVRPDGVERMLHADGAVVFDEDGKPLRMTGSVQDVTEQKQVADALQRAHDDLEERVEARTAALASANEQLYREMRDRERSEEALERSQRLASLGTLAAGIAHEINNPLNAIVFSAQAASLRMERGDGGQGVDEMLGKIKDEAFRCGRIVTSVLQFARQEASEKWPDSLSNVISKARDLTRKLAADRQVRVRVDASEPLPPLTINPTEMEQVFVNLISNSVEASEPGDCVTVRTELACDAARILVEDQGCGMTQEQVARVFDPFFTTRKHSGGTGLGLSVVHGIVEEHGGTIRAGSRPGRGSIFTIELPISPIKGGDNDESPDC